MDCLYLLAKWNCIICRTDLQYTDAKENVVMFELNNDGGILSASIDGYRSAVGNSLVVKTNVKKGL